MADAIIWMAMMSSDLLDAHQLAAELRLISNDDASFLNDLQLSKIDLTVDPEQWVRQVHNKIADLEVSIRKNRYAQYQNGGPKPLRSNGLPDWAEKERSQALQRSISAYAMLSERIKSRIARRSPPASSLFSAVQLALDVADIRTGLQLTKTSSTQIIFNQLSAIDIRLCLEWANHSEVSQNQIDEHYLTTLLGEYEATRLLSARAAELASISYYRALGNKVEDVSINQIYRTDSRWQECDLVVDGRPIDVKNARRSFSSKDSYVEHCVPRFKIDRATGSEVTINGVLSEYCAIADITGVGYQCRILGEVRVSDIRKLYVWARQRFGRFLSLEGLWKPDYQPGWVFEYPIQHYPQRVKSISKIGGLVNQLRSCGIADEQIPGWLHTLNAEPVPEPRIATEKLGILNDLRSMGREIGFSRPALFIFVMGLFLEVMISRQPGKTEDSLRELLFARGQGGSVSPLGLEDSQQYVANLIGILAGVRDEVFRQQIDLTGFKMTHPSVLRGLKRSGSWISLLAYCGGRLDFFGKSVKCGATPLFFGKHEVCSSCGYLVCDRCGYCSRNCDLVTNRQRSVAKQNHSKENSDDDWLSQSEQIIKTDR